MKRSAPDTLAWYAENAGRFFDDTIAVDLTPLHERFLALVPAGGHILDAGCGSGRDSKVFLERGYRVSAFDAAHQLAGLATSHLGQAVATRTFDDVDEVACYDGIWACASLLHLAAADIPGALQRLLVALKPGGEHHFLPHLCTAIAQADEIDLAVAFIKTTGMRLLLPDLRAVLGAQGDPPRQPTRVRILTSDHLDITDPEALRNTLGRRPTLAEFHRSGAGVPRVRQQYEGCHLRIAYLLIASL